MSETLRVREKIQCVGKTDSFSPAGGSVSSLVGMIRLLHVKF